MSTRRIAAALAAALVLCAVGAPAVSADPYHHGWVAHRHVWRRPYYPRGYYAPVPQVYYAPPPVYVPPPPPSVGFNLLFPFRIR